MQEGNIVQVEFFYSFGSRLKSAVRFFDQDGNITSLVRHMRWYEERRNTLLMSLPKESGWWKTIQIWRIRWLARKLERTRLTARQLVICQLRAIASAPLGDIGLENVDRSFRSARRNEMWGAVEDAERSVDIWLFVFEPDNLLANPVKSIAYAM